MKKQGTRWIMKKLTETYSKQEDGTLHSYDYFENEDGKWIYNFRIFLFLCDFLEKGIIY